MRRVLFVAGFAAAVGVAAGATPQEQSFRGGTHTVSVYTTVVDDAGQLVPNLSKDDFEIFDNGVRQELSVFTSALQPITVVLMLDRSGSVVSQFDLVQKSAERFIANLVKGDKARVGSFSNDVRIDPSKFTSDRGELVGILRNKLQDAGATPLWNATGAAMTALKGQPGRRVVLVFTDGFDSPGRPGPNVTADEVRDRMRAEEIMVYAIGLTDECGQPEPTTSRSDRASGAMRLFQGRGTPPPVKIPSLPVGVGKEPTGRGPGGRGIPEPGRRFPVPPGKPIPGDPFGRTMATGDGSDPCAGASKPDPELRHVASEGGGGYFELRNSDDLAATFARVADELHQQYLLGFSPTSLDGGTHTLEVRVKKPGALVRARKTYIAK